MRGLGWMACALFLAAAAQLMVSCNTADKQSGGNPGAETQILTSTALADGISGEGFTKLSAAETGIDFVNKAEGADMVLDQLSAQPGLGSGDYDGDGDVDLYLTGIEVPNRLYRNDGGWKFSDVTAESGKGLGGEGLTYGGAVFFDAEGDSDQDLYVCCRNGRNLFFINDGQGHFRDEAEVRQVASDAASVIAAPFDYDNDGDLDLYLGNYREGRNLGAMGDLEERDITAKFSKSKGEYTLLDEELAKTWYMDRAGKLRAIPDRDVLYRNDGKGSFSDVSEAAGISRPGWTLNVLACDFTNDGWTDLHLPGDFDTPDLYYINNGDGTFSERGEEMLRITSYFSMGSDAGDLNNDGLMDLFTVDMLARDYKDAKKQSGDMNQFRYELIHYRPQQNMRNCLYLNRGGGWMSECGQFSSIGATDWSWAARIVDLDSSGLPELYVTNGYITRNFEVDAQNTVNAMRREGRPEEEVSKFKLNFPPFVTDDVIFTCDKALHYRQAENNWGLKDQAVSYGSVVQDFDADGDLDLVTTCINQELLVYRNDLPNGNRVILDLRQMGANPFAVGSRVQAYCGDEVFTQDLILARGFSTGESGQIHLGLGRHEKIDRLEIRWPDNKLQIVENLPANMRHSIRKASGLPGWSPPEVEALFSQQDMLWEQVEQDTVAREFDNAVQPLLPVQRSMLGTGAGLADYNADGKLDLYLCGPSGQEGRLMDGDGAGSFVSVTRTAGMNDRLSEEMAALWLDADGDGRLDLLLSNGGMENAAGSPQYQDLLLLNKDKGFEKLSLPDGNISTGAACAADIDRDGSLEVFLAGQMKPHSFGSAVTSTLLTLKGGKPAAAGAKYAPQLGMPGPVNDAQFADVNGDGWQDLLMACEWSGLKLALNNKGVLAAPADISSKGMWQSIGAGDFDGDGDIDLIAGNWGANTKYHPKAGAPMTMFADDFDNNGVRDLIEVKHGKDCMLPGRGRSCSGYAISYIPEKWPTWEAFANATFEEVYGDPAQIAERFDAEELQNMLLLNDGSGSFDAVALPLEAQLAPVFGIAVGDYDNDGRLDAFLANNFYGPQPEVNHWNTGYGCLLLGDGAGQFKVLRPDESGINIWIDGRTALPADLNGDGRLDLVVSVSNVVYPLDLNGDGQIDIAEGEGLGHPKVCLNQGSGGSGLSVSLKGKAPNTQAVGARLVLELSDGRRLTRFVQAGSGYLGSYSGPQHFGIPDGASAAKLTVYWPDGSSSESADLASGTLSLSQP